MDTGVSDPSSTQDDVDVKGESGIGPWSQKGPMLLAADGEASAGGKGKGEEESEWITLAPLVWDTFLGIWIILGVSSAYTRYTAETVSTLSALTDRGHRQHGRQAVRLITITTPRAGLKAQTMVSHSILIHHIAPQFGSSPLASCFDCSVCLEEFVSIISILGFHGCIGSFSSISIRQQL